MISSFRTLEAARDGLQRDLDPWAARVGAVELAALSLSGTRLGRRRGEDQHSRREGRRQRAAGQQIGAN